LPNFLGGLDQSKKSMIELLENRRTAGQLLAEKLLHYKDNTETLVLALPRGGVPVAFEIARTLNLSLDVCLVRKLGSPRSKELAMGAIALGGIRVINEALVKNLHISPSQIEATTTREEEELQRRLTLYRGDRPFPNLKDRVLILVDDGIATGATIQVAIIALRQHHPKSIIIATPVIPQNTIEKLKSLVDEVVALVEVENLGSISVWYKDFQQTSDDEVCKLLATAVNEN